MTSGLVKVANLVGGGGQPHRAQLYEYLRTMEGGARDGRSNHQATAVGVPTATAMSKLKSRGEGLLRFGFDD